MNSTIVVTLLEDIIKYFISKICTHSILLDNNKYFEVEESLNLEQFSWAE